MNLRAFPALAALALLAGGAASANPRAEAIKAFDARQDRLALAQLEALATAAPDDAQLHDYLGRALLRAGRGERAARAFGRAVELAPDVSDYHVRLASALGQQAQQAGMFKAMSLVKKIKQHMHRAVELDPGSIRAREALMQFYAQAPGIAGGSIEEARKQAAAIEELQPSAGPRLQAFLLAVDERPEAEVIAAWEKAVAAPDATPGTRMSFGFYLQGRKKWDEALTQFDAVAKVDSSSVAPLYQVGRTAALSGERLADGEKALRAYLASGPKAEDDPAREAAHWRLGQVLQKAGRRDEARAQYQAALEENPDFSQAREALGKLD